MQFSLASQLIYEYRSLTTGYPEFIKKKNGEIATGEIPVFVFHTINPVEFESELSYLIGNGYVTLSIEDYYLAITGQKEVPKKSVLLTVDDARLSFWIYGYPLLKKYQAKVTLFVIPGMTEEDEARPCGLNAKYDIKLDKAICNWSELDQLNASGLVDIESHSLFHQQIFIGDRVIDFIDLNTPRSAYHTSYSPYLEIDDADRPIDYERLIGMPVFKSDSRMSGTAAIIIPDTLKNKLKVIYKRHNEQSQSGKFERVKVIRLLQRAISQGKVKFETREQVLNAIKSDLEKASKLLKLRYGTERGDHFCLPFTIGSDEMLEAAKQVGLKTCFWGLIPGKSSNPPGSDPYRLVRFKHDFIFRLPGKGRVTVPGIYLRKIKRRLSGELVY